MFKTHLSTKNAHQKHASAPVVWACCLALAFAACSNQQTNDEVIKIDMDDNSKAGLKATIEKTIKLETNDSILIGDISAMEYFENKFYFLDIRYSKSLFVFDKEGKFIAKTKNGEGPEEVLNPFGFYIDKKNKTVMLWDQQTRNMITYDLNLRYMTKKTYSVIIRDFARLGEDTFLAVSPKMKDDKLSFNSIYTKDFSQIIDNSHFTSADLESQTISKPISQFGQSTLFISPWDYNIYQVKKGHISTRYILDFGKYAFPDENTPLDKRWDLVRAGQKVGPVYHFSESKNFMTFSFSFNKKSISYLYSKKSKKSFKINNLYLDKTLPECEIQNTYPTDDTFIGIVEDKEYAQKYATAKTPKNSNIEDPENPILILIKVKE